MNRTANFNTWIECALGNEYFASWELLSPEIQKWWEQQDEQANCEGTGVIFPSICYRCPFCASYEVDEAD